MKKLAILALMLGGAPATAQQQEQSGDQQTIIVTGTRLDDAKKQLQDCLARNCPPVEDMAASLRYSEALFVSGDYRNARQILQSSIGRNDRHARQHPREVATLYRGDARISIHLGDGLTYRNSTYGAVRALKKGINDKHDPALISAQFDVAAMLLGLGKRDEAQSVYGDIARRAKAAGAQDLAGLAELKSAWIDYGGHNKRQGKAAIDRIAASADPELKRTRIAALILQSRIDRENGGTGNSERLIAATAGMGLEKPVLLWAPPLEEGSNSDGQVRNAKDANYGSQMLMASGENFEEKWADIGFWVRPDGSVEEPEVLRSVGSTVWIKPVLSQIARRVYSPSTTPGGSYRVERYTRTSLLFTPTGTRIAKHGAKARIEYVDLTADKPAQKSVQ